MHKIIYIFISFLIKLNRVFKQIIVMINDAFFCVVALYISFFLRLDEFNLYDINIIYLSLISTFFIIVLYNLAGVYESIFRFSGKSEVRLIIILNLIFSFFYILIISIYTIQNIPRSIGILHPLIFTILVILSRYCFSYFFHKTNIKNSKFSSKVVIYGAGIAGRKLVASLYDNTEFKVVAYIDDNPTLWGQSINGIKIYSFEDLQFLIDTKKINYILFAIPSLGRNKKLEILNKISKFKINIRSLPSIDRIVSGNVTISDIKELDVEDILGRDIVLPNKKLLSQNIKSKIVLVTGAGGSIGSELSRQIILNNPKKLILVEMNEFSLYKVLDELIELNSKLNSALKSEIIPLLATVKDENKMLAIIDAYKVDTIYHAAAYKHVSLVEENICEGIKNNVFGTLSVAKAALNKKVSTFVLISSDKAVRPANIMGASKRIAELCLQALFHYDKQKKTKLCMVRFGNVLDSSGSVIPKFKKQIKYGGPITLTHPEVTRYFMTIPEAAQLVIQAGAIAKGADVFALDMGKPVKILDLIKRIIFLSGLTLQNDDNLNGDINIKIIGLTPGEKLFEEVFLGENLEATEHIKIKRAKDEFIPWNMLEKDLKYLKSLLEDENINEIIILLQKLVDSFQWSGKIVDYLQLEKNNNQ